MWVSSHGADKECDPDDRPDFYADRRSGTGHAHSDNDATAYIDAAADTSCYAGATADDSARIDAGYP